MHTFIKREFSREKKSPHNQQQNSQARQFNDYCFNAGLNKYTWI